MLHDWKPTWKKSAVVLYSNSESAEEELRKNSIYINISTTRSLWVSSAREREEDANTEKYKMLVKGTKDTLED